MYQHKIPLKAPGAQNDTGVAGRGGCGKLPQTNPNGPNEHFKNCQRASNVFTWVMIPVPILQAGELLGWAVR